MKRILVAVDNSFSEALNPAGSRILNCQKTIIYILILFCYLSVVKAGPQLLSVDIDLNDTEKLQRGARIFMNYCSGCHSLKYMRYNRMAKDLGLTTFTGEVDSALLKSNLIFTSAKIFDPIENSMPQTDAREWFGRVPPDLSLSAREHGPDWIYTYLKSFYVDKKRPFGANNLLVPDVAMPNVLAPLQGVIIIDKDKNGFAHSSSEFVIVDTGEMSEQQFDSTIIDLVTFLTYVAEPNKTIRKSIGALILLYLFVFLIVAYQLKKLYWKDVN